MANTTTPLQSSLKYDGVNQRDLVATLENMRDVINANRSQVITTRALVNSIKTQVNALVIDMASRVTNHNTLATKLNADGGVTDTNYAAATAQTGVTVTATSLGTTTLSTISLLKA